jgi:hypothetical protein
MSAWVMSVVLCKRRLPVNFRYAPFATEFVSRCNMSRRANAGSRRFARGSGANAALDWKRGVARALIVNQYEWLFRHLEGILITRFGT